MLTKIMKILMIALFFAITMNVTVSANNLSSLSSGYAMSQQSFDLIDAVPDMSRFSSKLGEPYDETKDPALRKSAEPQEPQHGYFIVSILMLVGVGVFLYFLKMD